MSELPSAVYAPIDVELGGVLLANMLVGWLDGDPESSLFVEVADELSSAMRKRCFPAICRYKAG